MSLPVNYRVTMIVVGCRRGLGLYLEENGWGGSGMPSSYIPLL